MKLIVDPTGFADSLKERMAEVKMRAQLFESQALMLSRKFQEGSVRLQYLNTLVQERMAQDLHTIMDRTEILKEKLARVEVLESLDSFLQTVMGECMALGKGETKYRSLANS